jgi:ABC-type enterochelin transport system permease subunit
VGYNDLKTASVYFYVQRNSSYAINTTVVPYENEQLNSGRAMNITSGVFTAPVSGRYFFSFVGRAITTETFVFLRVNGSLNTIAYGSGLWFNFVITATLNLRKMISSTCICTVGLYLIVHLITPSSQAFC